MANTFIITPGELDSIGLEVTLKALSNIKIENAYVFYTKKDLLKEHLKKTPLNLEETTLPVSLNLNPGFYYIDSPKEPVEWFKEACVFCDQNPQNTALITGPLTKKSFNDPQILGHTEYLRSLYPSSNLFMTFFGEIYNCLLLNDHIPLSKVSSTVNLELIEGAFKTIDSMFKNSNIGLLGLNPHAGEGGLLGREEISTHNKACEKHFSLKGPLSSDGFFNLDSYKSYDFLIANYHDQGLIPFKLINGFNASQASLGLPFIRTSVDHGTGSDIFMKNKANPESMIHAINLAHKLLTLKNN